MPGTLLAVEDTSHAGCSPASPVDMDLLNEMLDFVRPALQSDGGDLTLLGVDDDGVVEVELIGACRTCPLSMVTLTAGIEAVLLQRVPGVTGVVSQLPEPVQNTSAPPFSPAEALATGTAAPAAVAAPKRSPQTPPLTPGGTPVPFIGHAALPRRRARLSFDDFSLSRRLPGRREGSSRGAGSRHRRTAPTGRRR